jgi:choline dehydrogenase-like flavoprotein
VKDHRPARGTATMTNQIGRRHLFKAAGAAGLAATLPTTSPGAQPAVPHQSWDAPNLFVMGAAVYPQNAGYNPTGTVGALTYWAADAIKDKYLKKSGSLI